MKCWEVAAEEEKGRESRESREGREASEARGNSLAAGRLANLAEGKDTFLTTGHVNIDQALD